MILIGLFQSTAYAELTLLKEQLFTESEESIQRRTYSYDFDVSPQGIVHAIFAKATFPGFSAIDSLRPNSSNTVRCSSLGQSPPTALVT
jgi:hypothetical protein